MKNDKDADMEGILYNQLNEHPLDENWFKENKAEEDLRDPLLFYKIDYYSHHIKRILAQYDRVTKTNLKLKKQIKKAYREL